MTGAISSFVPHKNQRHPWSKLTQILAKVWGLVFVELDGTLSVDIYPQVIE